MLYIGDYLSGFCDTATCFINANLLSSGWPAASVALAQPNLIIRSSAERRSPTFARPSKRRSYFGGTFSDRHSRKNSKGESGRGVKRPESGSSLIVLLLSSSYVLVQVSHYNYDNFIIFIHSAT